MMRVRDFQRSRLYKWERSQSWWEGNDWATPGSMSLPQCKALIKRATKRYGAWMPSVRDGRGNRNASGSASVIKLPRWARSMPVVLHESGHAINSQRGTNGAPYGDKHGPVFLRLFIQLLATYMKLDEADLVRSAKAAGLKVAGHQPVRRIAARRAA